MMSIDRLVEKCGSTPFHHPRSAHCALTTSFNSTSMCSPKATKSTNQLTSQGVSHGC